MPNVTMMMQVARESRIAGDKGTLHEQVQTAVKLVDTALKDDGRIDKREANFLDSISKTSGLAAAAREYLKETLKRQADPVAGTPPPGSVSSLVSLQITERLSSDKGTPTEQLDAAVELVDKALEDNHLDANEAALLTALSKTSGLGAAARAYLQTTLKSFDKTGRSQFQGTPQEVSEAVGRALDALETGLTALQQAIEAAPTAWPKRQHVFSGGQTELKAVIETLKDENLSGEHGLRLQTLEATFKALDSLSRQND